MGGGSLAPGCRNALRRPGACGVTADVDRRCLIAAGGGEDLGEVDGPGARVQPRQPPADMHQAGTVARGADLGAGGEHAAHLVGEHGRGHVRVLDRERATEAAAHLGIGQLHQIEPGDVAQQPQRAVTGPQQPQRVAGRVVGDAVGVVGPDVLHPQHVGQELRQLEGPGGHVLRAARQAGVPVAPGHHRVLVADGAGARAGRHDDRLVAAEHLGVPADQRQRVPQVPGVHVHLPAARLGLGELHLVAEPLQQPHRRLPHVGEQGVREAGHEQVRPACPDPVASVTAPPPSAAGAVAARAVVAAGALAGGALRGRSCRGRSCRRPGSTGGPPAPARRQPGGGWWDALARAPRPAGAGPRSGRAGAAAGAPRTAARPRRRRSRCRRTRRWRARREPRIRWAVISCRTPSASRSFAQKTAVGRSRGGHIRDGRAGQLPGLHVECRRLDHLELIGAQASPPQCPMAPSWRSATCRIGHGPPTKATRSWLRLQQMRHGEVTAEHVVDRHRALAVGRRSAVHEHHRGAPALQAHEPVVGAGHRGDQDPRTRCSSSSSR